MASYTLDLTGADGDVPGLTVIPTTSPLQKVSNLLSGSTSVAAADGGWLDQPLTDDQEIEFTNVVGFVGSTNRALLAARVRDNRIAVNYEMRIDRQGSSDIQLDVYKSGVLLVSDPSHTPVDNATWITRVTTVAGNAFFEFLKGGVVQFDYTDSTSPILSGDADPAGIVIYTNGTTLTMAPVVFRDVGGSDIDVDIDAGAMSVEGQSFDAEIDVAIDTGTMSIQGQSINFAFGEIFNVTIDAGAISIEGQLFSTFINSSGGDTERGRDGRRRGRSISLFGRG